MRRVPTMDDLIDEYFDRFESFSIESEIPGFQRWLRDKYPHVLTAWILKNEQAFLARAVGTRQRELRTRARKATVNRVFSSAIDAMREGDGGSALSEFALTCSVKNHRRIRVGDMTGADHRYVAHRYEVNGNRSKLMAAFHEAVAARVGDQPTREALTEEQYARLRAEITGEDAPATPLAELLMGRRIDE